MPRALRATYIYKNKAKKRKCQNKFKLTKIVYNENVAIESDRNYERSENMDLELQRLFKLLEYVYKYNHSNNRKSKIAELKSKIDNYKK